MSELKEVGISGAVGKQVFASTKPVILKSVITTSTVSAGTIIVRDGNASGDVRLTIVQPINSSSQKSLDGKRFDRGMHVKVTGIGSLTYLEIK